MTQKKEKYRKIYPRIWNDEKFRRLSDDGKLVFFLLLTHPHMTAVGAMRGTIHGLAAEMGWLPERLSKAFREALAEGMVKHDEDASFIWLPNWLEYNAPESPNVVKSWIGAWQYLPECELQLELLQQLKDFTEGLTEAFREAFQEAFREALRKAFRKPSGNQEQEQEQLQEPEQEEESYKTELNSSSGEGISEENDSGPSCPVASSSNGEHPVPFPYSPKREEPSAEERRRVAELIDGIDHAGEKVLLAPGRRDLFKALYGRVRVDAAWLWSALCQAAEKADENPIGYFVAMVSDPDKKPFRNFRSRAAEEMNRFVKDDAELQHILENAGKGEG